MKTKFCTKCKREKLLTDFYIQKSHIDGYRSQCKDCVNIENKNYLLKNKLKIQEKAKLWRIKNRKRVLKKQKLYRINNKKQINKQIDLWRIKDKKTFPWKYTLQAINQRCNNPNHNKYKFYGGRGIKCLITLEELKTLWFRDKAYLMKQPSIDRICHNGNYTFENCRYIEFKENITQNIKKRIILQFDLNGIFIKEWESIAMASKILNINISGISQCLRKTTSTSANFIWKYK
jgi:hypothetical protein